MESDPGRIRGWVLLIDTHIVSRKMIDKRVNTTASNVPGRYERRQQTPFPI